MCVRCGGERKGGNGGEIVREWEGKRGKRKLNGSNIGIRKQKCIIME